LSEVLGNRYFSIRRYANNGRNAINVGNTNSGRDFTAVEAAARAEFYPHWKYIVVQQLLPCSLLYKITFIEQIST
jgi:hypothetical protein